MKYIKKIFETYEVKNISDDDYSDYYANKLDFTDKEILSIKTYLDQYLVKSKTQVLMIDNNEESPQLVIRGAEVIKSKKGEGDENSQPLKQSRVNIISIEITNLSLDIIKAYDDWFIVRCEINERGWNISNTKCDELEGLIEFLDKRLFKFPKFDKKIEDIRSGLLKIISKMSNNEILNLQKIIKK